MSDRLPWVIFLPVIALDIAAIADLVIRKDLKLSTKLLWGLAVLLLPAVGATIYLLARYKVFSTVRKSL